MQEIEKMVKEIDLLVAFFAYLLLIKIELSFVIKYMCYKYQLTKICEEN